MNDTYRTWIDNWLENHGGPNKDGYGKCKEAAEAMHVAFPELTVTRGHVYCPAPWGQRGHWWLKTAVGEIVDPTVYQFGFILDYEEYFEGMEIRLGRCMECGTEIYGPESLEGVYSTAHCDETCESAFSASLL